MSDFTDEMEAVVLELAVELGEGLVATFYESASENLDPDTNQPGVSTTRYFNPETQSYDESAAVAAGGVETATSVGVPPPSVIRQTPFDSQGTIRGTLRLTTPRIFRADGSRLVPMSGMRVGLLDRYWQIVAVRWIGAGDDVAGYSIDLSGGGA